MIPKQEKHSLATNQIIDETIPSKIVSKIMETSIKTLKVLIFLKALSPRDGRVYPFGARVTRAMPRSLESSSPDWARRTQKRYPHGYLFCVSMRARDGTRTRGPDLGKVVLHQLSHSRKYHFAIAFSYALATLDY